MIDPPRWTADRLEADAKTAIEDFRKERLEEPLEAYLEAFDRFQDHVAELLETTTDLTNLDATALDCLTKPEFLRVLRFLTGPFISDDDLKTVAEADSLNASRLRNDAECVSRIVQVIATGLDKRRFAWVSEDREATEAERLSAIHTTAALMATQYLGTTRRSAGKTTLEGLTEGALTAIGFVKVANRRIQTFNDAPDPGHFCGESYLGNRKADFVVRLWDSRILAIECKASNSATNSVKRLNNDAAAKAEAWKRDFGQTQVVPAAVLSGVFKRHNLEDAQNRGLTLFWGHSLNVLTDWIESTRTNARA